MGNEFAYILVLQRHLQETAHRTRGEPSGSAHHGESPNQKMDTKKDRKCTAASGRASYGRLRFVDDDGRAVAGLNLTNITASPHKFLGPAVPPPPRQDLVEQLPRSGP